MSTLARYAVKSTQNTTWKLITNLLSLMVDLTAMETSKPYVLFVTTKRPNTKKKDARKHDTP